MPTPTHQPPPPRKLIPRAYREAFKRLNIALKNRKKRLTPAEKERRYREIFGMCEPGEITPRITTS